MSLDGQSENVCTTCNSVCDETKPAIQCNLCQKWCHSSCTDLTEEEFNGLKISGEKSWWFCGTCIPTINKFIAMTENQNLVVTPTNHTPSSTQCDTSKVPANPITLSTGFTGAEEREICPKFRRGKCPHGLSGRTEVSGKLCEYEHPKRCRKFCSYGSRSRFGCSKGKNCEYFHPILCKYSVQQGICTNLDCTFTHLKNTKRYRYGNSGDMPAISDQYRYTTGYHQDYRDDKRFQTKEYYSQQPSIPVRKFHDNSWTRGNHRVSWNSSHQKNTRNIANEHVPVYDHDRQGPRPNSSRSHPSLNCNQNQYTPANSDNLPTQGPIVINREENHQNNFNFLGHLIQQLRQEMYQQLSIMRTVNSTEQGMQLAQTRKTSQPPAPTLTQAPDIQWSQELPYQSQSSNVHTAY